MPTEQPKAKCFTAYRVSAVLKYVIYDSVTAHRTSCAVQLEDDSPQAVLKALESVIDSYPPVEDGVTRTYVWQDGPVEYALYGRKANGALIHIADLITEPAAKAMLGMVVGCDLSERKLPFEVGNPLLSMTV